MRRFIIKNIAIIFIVLAGIQQANSQSVISDTLKTGTIEAQINTLEARTRTYDNYRAIREDYFQTFNQNALDSLNKEKGITKASRLTIKQLNNNIDSLQRVIASTNASLESTLKTKDSMSLFGAEVGKVLYNTILLSIIGILLALLVLGLVIFNKNISSTRSTKTEYEELAKEYEEYKKKVRVEREKTNVEHFREIQKIKGLQ